MSIQKQKPTTTEIAQDSKEYWERCVYGGGFKGERPIGLVGGLKSGDFLNYTPESLREKLTSAWVSRNQVGCGLDSKTGEEFYQELSAMDLKGLRILEFGCGSGLDALHMTQRGAIVTACDIVPNNVRLTDKVLDFEGSLSGAVLLESYDDIPLYGKFDMVFSNGVLMNIQPDKIEYVVEQLKSVLKPGGVLMCMVYTDVYYPHANAHFEGPYVRGFSIDQLTKLIGLKLASYRIFNQRTYMWGVFTSDV
jgi:2-polyprenyl-3-methyl-5-hydroxy-6-metoxy-1,4-benzoquinol methylase